MDFKDRKILVTGANGFLGSRVCKRLAEEGAQVRAIVRRPGETPGLKHERIEEMEGNFVDPENVGRAAKDMDFIIHCAATVGKDLDEARSINTTGTRSVVDAAMNNGCKRFVHISSVAVYDTGDLTTVNEDAPLVTAGHQYGLTKAEADGVLFEAMKNGLEAVILRPSAILGVHPTSSWGVKVPGRIREGKMPLQIDGGNTYAYIHVENLVDAILLSIEKDQALGQIYNVVDGHTTWLEFTDQIRGWFEAPPLSRIPKEEVAPGAYWTGKFAAQKIQSELGYSPRLSYQDGMDEAKVYWQKAVTA